MKTRGILADKLQISGRKSVNILVCDDDREIVEAVDIYLTQEAYDGQKA